MAVSCEMGNKYFGFYKSEGFFDQLNVCVSDLVRIEFYTQKSFENIKAV